MAGMATNEQSELPDPEMAEAADDFGRLFTMWQNPETRLDFEVALFSLGNEKMLSIYTVAVVAVVNTDGQEHEPVYRLFAQSVQGSILAVMADVAEAPEVGF